MGAEVVVVTSITTTLSFISSSTSCSFFVVMLTPVSRTSLPAVAPFSRIVLVRSSRVSRKALRKEHAVEKPIAENLRKKIAPLHVLALVSQPHMSRARRAISNSKPEGSCLPPFILLSVKS